MKRKLAGFGLAFSLAELAAAYLPPLVSTLTAVFLIVGLLYQGLRRWRPMLVGALIGMAYALLFASMVTTAYQDLVGRKLPCVAVVETDCEASYQDGMLCGTLLVTEINGESANLKVYCAAFPGLAPGNRLSMELSFSELEENSYRMSRLARDVILQAAYEGDFAMLEDDPGLRFSLYRLRKALTFRMRYWLPKRLAALEAAMLLGNKDMLSETQTQTFRAAGVSHLLAVSGLHVTMLCGLAGAGGRRKRRFYRPSILLSGMTVLFYMLLTGAPVSVVRAGGVFLLALLGDFLLQPSDLLTSTGLVAVLMGLLNAYAPCDVGFQLSFCAVLGVQAASAAARWEEKHLTLPAPVFAFLDTVQCSLLAALATTPVLVAHSLTVSGVGVLCNLLVVWMLQPALLLGLVVLALSLFACMGPVFHLVSLLLAVWLNWMTAIVQWCAALPFAKLCLPREFTLWVLVILAALGLLFYAAKRICWFAPAMLLCIMAAVWAGTVMNRDVVRIALVGTAGNPCVVITQNGSAAVVFRGGSKNLLSVKEYLAANGDPQWEVLVDLRDDPQPLDFPLVPTVLSLDELETSEQQVVLKDLTLDLTHAGSSNLAVVGVGGYHVAIMSGNVRLPQPILVDVLCAAGSYPVSVQAKSILYTNRNPDWLEKTNGETLYYGGETPLIVVRPGCSLTFQGVTKIAVQ